MSKNEKQNMIEQFKYNVINSKNTGKKVIQIVDGKKIKVPKKYLGKYHNACRLIKTNQFNQLLINPLPEFEPIINRSNYLKDEYYKLQLKYRILE